MSSAVPLVIFGLPSCTSIKPDLQLESNISGEQIARERSASAESRIDSNSGFRTLSRTVNLLSSNYSSVLCRSNVDDPVVKQPPNYWHTFLTLKIGLHPIAITFLSLLQMLIYQTHFYFTSNYCLFRDRFISKNSLAIYIMLSCVLTLSQIFPTMFKTREIRNFIKGKCNSFGAFHFWKLYTMFLILC